MKLVATIGRWLPIGVSLYLALLSLRILVSQESFSIRLTGHIGLSRDEAVRVLIIFAFSLIALGLIAWRAWARWLGAIVYSVLTSTIISTTSVVSSVSSAIPKRRISPISVSTPFNIAARNPPASFRATAKSSTSIAPWVKSKKFSSPASSRNSPAA